MLVIVAVLVPVVLIGSAFLAAEATRSNTFCGTKCHEMDPYYQTWQASSHSDVDCVKCHIPSGAVNYAKTKFFALREVWVHFTNKDLAPIAVTRHIPNDTCTSCHDSSQMQDAVPLARWTTRFRHSGHEQVPECIECHAQVVHAPIEGIPYTPPGKMASCFTCHDGTAQPDDCVYCHRAPHPDRGTCETCHGLKAWDPSVSHSPRLITQHQEFPCERCHTVATPTDIGFPAGCVNCHKPPHPLKVGKLRLQRCAQCHTILHWKPNTFDHPSSGCVQCHGNQHGSAQLTQCGDCHSQTTWAGAKHPDTSCTACHTAGPLHSGLSTQCQSCHVSGAYWVPSTFRHKQVGEHVPSGERPLACTQCHKTTYATATCTPCHGPGGPPPD